MKLRACALWLAGVVPLAAGAPVVDVDILIYGGTSAGVAAAVQARRMGKSVTLVEWTRHLGGLTTGGLGATDIGNKGAIGGIAREFYEAIARHYARPEAWRDGRPDDPEARRRGVDPLVARTGKDTRWTFEPHVALAIYQRWLADAGVTVHLGQGIKRVATRGDRIESIVTTGGSMFRARMYIDASYEGDLMAKAGVPYHVGREANSIYGETLNGVRAETPKHQFIVDVDPYRTPGDRTSGLLPFIGPGDPGESGAGDRSVQAYNFRMCMTRTRANLVPWSELKPPGYDEGRYELLARLIEAHERAGRPLGVDQLMHPVPMPNDKTDTNNNGAFSTDHIGANHDYPDADYAMRAQIRRDHENYTRGFFYFLATSERVPARLREEMNTWGLARDEFAETGHFPPQLYVREARRMISDYVMTEADCRWLRKAEDPVALGAYGMDSHNCRRLVRDGFARNEGDVQVRVAGPYPVSYRSIVPGRGRCANLFVPVCLAASHIAYGSIRMEPVFMILGQSAATAAALAIDAGAPVQALPYPRLRDRLVADGQVLEWTGGRTAPADNIDARTLPGVVVDDEQAELHGVWIASSSARSIGIGYHHDGDAEKGRCRALFRPVIPAPGRYEIFLHYPPLSNRSGNTPVTVALERGPKKTLVIDQRKAGSDNAVSLGRYDLGAGRSVTVTISNEGTAGHVIADAVQLAPVKE